MKTIKIHRKYQDGQWEYRAIAYQVLNSSNHMMDVIYYENPIESINGFEVYTGGNYVFGCKNRNWSRSYKMDNIPKVHQALVKKLKQIHADTDWTIESDVNKN